jgi:nitroreductase
MQPSDLYRVMFERKSVRNYDQAPLDPDTLAGISTFTSTLIPMDNGIKTEFKLAGRDDVKGLLSSKAPHYILAFSEAKGNYLANMGFMIQQVDLYLSASGIGSCWRGLQGPAKSIKKTSSLGFVITLAFGTPAEPVHRANVSEFDRKSLDQVRTATGMDDLLEPARLAPSGMNTQPWFFTGGDGLLHAYCIKQGSMTPGLLKKMNAINVGIALCHVWVAAKYLGKTIEFSTDESARNSGPAGFYYVTTLNIS